MRAFVRAVRETDEGISLQSLIRAATSARSAACSFPKCSIGAVTELERAMNDGVRRSGVLARVPRRAARLRRPAVADVPRRTVWPARTRRRSLFKREDLNHTGAHKINNTVGQALLGAAHGQEALHRRDRRRPARRRDGDGRRRSSAFPVDVYMGAVDVERQALNVYMMKLLGAKVHPVDERHADAQGRDQRSVPRLGRRASRIRSTSSAAWSARIRIRTWCASSKRSSGSKRARRCSSATAGCRRDVVACVGGGSNAMGIFAGFVDDPAVKLWGVEAGGPRRCTSIDTAASINAGTRRHPARLALVRAADARRPGARHALDQRRASTIRASGPSTRSCSDRGRATYVSAHR